MYDVGSETRQVTEHAWAVAGPADRTTWAQVIRQARCADVSLDADEWFPVSTHPDSARREAAAAIAICDACPVRAQCLALSLRHWSIGQHGVWGGLVPAERAALRRRRLASWARSASASRRRRDHARPGIPALTEPPG